MKKKLTIKQTKLVQAKAAGKTHVQAYREVYSATASEATAVSNTDKILKSEHIANALQKELARQGITLEHVVAPVTRALTDDNIELQLKGHDRAMKILVDKSEPKGTTIIFNKGDVVKSKYVKD